MAQALTSEAPRASGRLTALEFASVGASIAALGISRVGFNVVGNHMLGLETVGLANLCLSIALLTGLPVSAGLAAAISRFLPLIEAPGQATRMLRAVVAWAVACLALGGAIAFVTQRVRSSDGAFSGEIAVIALWAVLYATYAIGRAHLFAERRTKLALVLEFLALASFGLGLLVASMDRFFWWLPFALYPIPMVVRLMFDLARPASRSGSALPMGFGRYAALAFLGSAASLGVQYGSTLVAGARGGIGHAGVWATLTSVAAPVLLLPRSLSTIFLPRLSRLTAGPQEAFHEARREHARIAAHLACPATALPMLLGPVLLPAVLGVSIDRQVAVTWVIVCLATYVICRKEPTITAIAARGHAGVNATAAFVAASLCAVVWIAGPAWVGQLPALALGFLLQAFSSPAISTMLARRVASGDRFPWSVHAGDFAIAVATVCSLVGGENPLAVGTAVLVVVTSSLLGVRRAWASR